LAFAILAIPHPVNTAADVEGNSRIRLAAGPSQHYSS
jgi:hypothetical protein